MPCAALSALSAPLLPPLLYIDMLIAMPRASSAALLRLMRARASLRHAY